MAQKGCTQGTDQNHWLQTQQELTDADRLIEVRQDNLTLIVRVPVASNPGSTLLASISPRSILLLSLLDEPDEEDTSASVGELLRVITLPVEIDPEQVAAFIDDKHLTLRLSVSAVIPALA